MRFTCGGAPQHVLRPRFTVRLAGTQLHALRWPLLALHRGARARACLCTAAPAWHECAKCGRGCTCAQLRRPRGLRGTRAPGCMRPTAPTSRAARHRGAEETAHVRCSVRACGQRGGGARAHGCRPDGAWAAWRRWAWTRSRKPPSPRILPPVLLASSQPIDVARALPTAVGRSQTGGLPTVGRCGAATPVFKIGGVTGFKLVLAAPA